MEQKYDPHKIESKWQEIWDEKTNDYAKDFDKKPKHYHLVEFPFPSGEGLHVGHCMSYGASDAYCRMKRMQGFNVMFPMGWDAFGLPTENFAIKNKVKPQDATKQNISNFKKQMKMLGYSFDWDREVNTTDPHYFKWTQWIFLQFYKHGIDKNGDLIEIADDDMTTPRLAFQAEIPINWCPSCKIGLANEEVIAGRCERCGTETIKKTQKQWMLRITAYAERLINDLDLVEYLPKIKTQQINWIGKSTGTNIKFKLTSKVQNKEIEVFTTRADTLFGVTYLVVAPESNYVSELLSKVDNKDEVEKYIDSAKKKSDLERTELIKDKTGVPLEGIYAVNPINNEKIPVWVADYVLASYGTGAVMAVPAHDERDWEFAVKYNLPIKEVIMPREGEPHEGAEFRNTVSLVLQRKNDKKFLLLRWKNFDWISFPLGGVEDGESPEEALKREVLEETGYKIKPIKKLGGLIESHFYADHKKVWRSRHDQPYLCELEKEEPENVAENEKKLHEPIWLTEKEVLEKVTHPYNLIGFKRFISGNYAYIGNGVLINSNGFDGLTSEDAKLKITEKLKEMDAGDFSINYKLRDWVFSRQHYWGEPIPIVYCEKCGQRPLSEKDLPLELPEVENYEPTNTGESPLANIKDWVETTCPDCGGGAMRETDTMPNWAGSSWYGDAYALNEDQAIDKSKTDNIFTEKTDALKYWMPVDIYNGGMEHTTLHLLYSRFWHKFLYDLGCVPGPEPYFRRIAHGIILGPDGQKMSKSKGNVINPDDMVKKYGADAVRAYIMFIGPYDQESAWSTSGIQGVYRFLVRVYNNFRLVTESEDSKELLIKLNQSIQGITDDLLNFRLNTVVSKLMELNNAIEKAGQVSRDNYNVFLKLLFPVAPFIASELWQENGQTKSLQGQSWPKPDENYLVEEQIEIVVQVNGKVRDRLIAKPGLSRQELEESALNLPKIKEITEGYKIEKIIVIPDKIVSIVIRQGS